MVAVALFGPDSCRAIFDATGNYRNRLLFGCARACQRAVIELKQPAAAGASRSIRAHAGRGASRACEHARRRRRTGRGARARAYGARGALTEAPPLQNIRGQVVPAAREATERFETRA
ncbi:hypothetical protein [Burkholderia pseudomallei]|uniref:hypothetical protein n=1 Tax=Burkholderia pseudomallei TaxID=28450 RepID=UPI00040AE081|nr:hypothetical protein [Burkholderia pseudomallei]ALB12610.1 hypothetical protein ACT79_17720 [Burkholderia pseudomallei]